MSFQRNIRDLILDFSGKRRVRRKPWSLFCCPEFSTGFDRTIKQGTDILLSLLLHTTSGRVSLISVYAPTISATKDSMDVFYTQLDSLVNMNPKEEHLVLLVD
ncbi:hypothetical protein DPMN_117144 [Dreissena polymorpha]|uniref:Uncharacterized protein n=1 Tax=Dreissena polymorpha TaxID=45954 RepID=A0A9D4KPB1_DREPO|nr:hypothetical protein DPMN_117144 [Dreissena polymorpha]